MRCCCSLFKFPSSIRTYSQTDGTKDTFGPPLKLLEDPTWFRKHLHFGTMICTMLIRITQSSYGETINLYRWWWRDRGPHLGKKREENKVFVVSDSALLVIAGYGTDVCPPGGSTRWLKVGTKQMCRGRLASNITYFIYTPHCHQVLVLRFAK